MAGRSMYPRSPDHQRANAKFLRREMTDPERRLWKAIRIHVELRNTHFRRQVSLGPYIADFCCHAAKLILEVDGDQHVSLQADYDSARTFFLQAQGFRVLRFSNRDVMHDMGGVLALIEAALEGTISSGFPTPTPTPPHKGEGH